LRITNAEWITNVTGHTTADGRVVNHIALGVEATRAGTGIAALLINAGLMTGTLSIDGTLRTAIGWSTQILGQAGAGWSAVNLATLRIRSARRRNTGVKGFTFDHWRRSWN